ncbi:guanylate kinase [Batrachochytrium salamandrivorans]|nr:guanylate kinase [Batrachochytrium salamandrivorans]
MKHVFRRKPLVICGPSGVGKGTITDLLLKTHPISFSKAVSHTTRQPRAGELPGRDYHFVERFEHMQEKISQGEFIEYAKVHGNLYGTSFATLHSIDHVLNRICVLDIDVAGLRQINQVMSLGPGHHHNPQVNRVGIIPNSLAELERRLRGRNSETEANIRKRLQAAEEEIRAIKEDGIVDHVIVNEDSWKVGYPRLEQLLEEWYPQVFTAH